MNSPIEVMGAARRGARDDGTKQEPQGTADVLSCDTARRECDKELANPLIRVKKLKVGGEFMTPWRQHASATPRLLEYSVIAHNILLSLAVLKQRQVAGI